jgi:hypothetical protein
MSKNNIIYTDAGITDTLSSLTPSNTVDNDPITNIILQHVEHKLDAHANAVKQELLSERSNTLTIFGVFASLVTFFSIEIQVFKNIDNFWLIIALTSFLVSSFLLFVFSIHAIAQKDLKWGSFFKNPVFTIFLIFLIFSFVIFYSKLNCPNVSITNPYSLSATTTANTGARTTGSSSVTITGYSGARTIDSLSDKRTDSNNTK